MSHITSNNENWYSYTLPKKDRKNILITWHSSWLLLISAFFHRKAAIFAISRNTDIGCLLIHNLIISMVTIGYVSMVTILMMSAKMVTLVLLKIKVFWNKCCDVMNRNYEVLLRDSNHFIHMATWPMFGNSSISSCHNLNFIRILPEKPVFFEGLAWYKFNKLGLALVMALKFYISLAKGLKLKVRKFFGLFHTFTEDTREKVEGDSGVFAPLNRVKI